MKYELRCANCGKILTYNRHSAWPGTSEPTISVEPCCPDDKTCESISSCKEIFNDMLTPVKEEAYCSRDSLAEIVKLFNSIELATTIEEVEDAMDDSLVDHELSELKRSVNWFEISLVQLENFIEEMKGEMR